MRTEKKNYSHPWKLFFLFLISGRNRGVESHLEFAPRQRKGEGFSVFSAARKWISSEKKNEKLSERESNRGKANKLFPLFSLDSQSRTEKSFAQPLSLLLPPLSPVRRYSISYTSPRFSSFRKLGTFPPMKKGGHWGKSFILLLPPPPPPQGRFSATTHTWKEKKQGLYRPLATVGRNGGGRVSLRPGAT